MPGTTCPLCCCFSTSHSLCAASSVGIVSYYETFLWLLQTVLYATRWLCVLCCQLPVQVSVLQA